MKRSEFIARAYISLVNTSIGNEGFGFDRIKAEAEALADEYAKSYPFEDDGVSEGVNDGVDPYAVNFEDAPKWAMYHAVDSDGRGHWYELNIRIHVDQWIPKKDLSEIKPSSIFDTENWRESLRKRPKKK